MNMSLYPRRSRGRDTLLVVGWLFLVGLGIALTWYGFTWTEEADQPEGTPSSVAVSDTSPQATVWPTITSLPSPMPTTQAEPLSAGTEGWADEVFQLINQIRAEHGLTPYTRNEVLELAAQLHGQDSAQRGELSHIGSDGSNVTTRVQRAGYEVAGVSEITVTGNSPQWAVDWWIDETPPNDPHRSAILSTWYTEIGVAAVPAGHTHYFIAVLGRPKTP